MSFYKEIAAQHCAKVKGSVTKLEIKCQPGAVFKHMM